MGKMKNSVTLDDGSLPTQAQIRRKYDQLMHEATIASTASAVKDLSVAATTAVIRSPVVSAAITIRGARNIASGFRDFYNEIRQEIDRQDRNAK
jgi:hypothetical protein